MERESFVFYSSFLKAIRAIKKRDIQAELALAIIEYGLTGETTECGEMVSMAMELIKPQIEANNQKFINGSKGGNPNFKKGQSNPYYSNSKDNQEITERLPKDNQEITERLPKDNQEITERLANVNDNVNVNVDIISPHTPQGDLLGDFQETDTKGESSKTKNQEPKENPNLKTEEEKSQTDNTGGAGDGEKIDFERLLIAINEITGRDFRIINEAVKRKFRARLKEGYTKEDIFNTIKNATLDKCHNETGRKYLTPEYFSRPQTIDKYRDVAKIKQKPQSASPKREVGDL